MSTTVLDQKRSAIHGQGLLDGPSAKGTQDDRRLAFPADASRIHSVTAEPQRGARLPPHYVHPRLLGWFTVALYSVTGGRFGLRSPTADRWGMMRLRTVGRRTRRAAHGHPRLFSRTVPIWSPMAMDRWADPDPAWWLQPSRLGPDASVDLHRWIARRPCTCSGHRRAATPVGQMGRLRRESRCLRRLEMHQRDPGCHPGAAARLNWTGAAGSDKGSRCDWSSRGGGGPCIANQTTGSRRDPSASPPGAAWHPCVWGCWAAQGETYPQGRMSYPPWPSRGGGDLS